MNSEPDVFIQWVELFLAFMPKLNQGLLVSISLIVPSALFGLGLGIIVGTSRAVGSKSVRKFFDAYVALFRGTPLVVQLVIIYYGLGKLGLLLQPLTVKHGWPPIGEYLSLPRYWAAILGFSLCSGAYHSEYIRGGIMSIRRGQFLAARALGFSDLQTFLVIIMPQAVRRALPGCGNEIIYLIKYSSLVYIITVVDLTGQARALTDQYYRHMEIYLMAAVYYLIMVSLATWLLRWLEKRYYIPGFTKS